MKEAGEAHRKTSLRQNIPADAEKNAVVRDILERCLEAIVWEMTAIYGELRSCPRGFMALHHSMKLDAKGMLETD